MARHPMGLAQCVDGKAILEGDRFPHQLVGGAPVKLHVAGQRDGVIPRLRQRLAHIGGLDLGQVLDLLGDEPRQPHQDAPPLGGGQRAPFACQCLLRGADRVVDIHRIAPRDAADFLARRGVFQRQGLAAGGQEPAAADEHFCGVEPELHGISPFVHSRAGAARRPEGPACRDGLGWRRRCLSGLPPRSHPPASPSPGR